MARYRTTRRRSNSGQAPVRPFVAFLLVASFGILFAGCSGEQQAEIPQADQFSFTAEDIARVRELMGNGSGAGLGLPRLELPTESGSDAVPVLDLSEVNEYNAIRTSNAGGDNLFRVTNQFLNVRAQPQVTSAQLERLEQGDTVKVIEFVDAAWAKIEVDEETEGYVASRYISKILSERQLQAEKVKYDGLYFVDFAFLNVRNEADSNSEKIGELPGQAFVRPLSMDDVWARVPFGDGDGYVAVQYLTEFLPNFLVRQSEFTLPTLHYRLSSEGVLDVMPRHIAALQDRGYTVWDTGDFYRLLEQQEQRDVRLPPNTVMLTVSDVTPANIEELLSVLRASAVEATLFVQSKHFGPNGFAQQQLLNAIAAGHEIQSAGHTGDDMRSLTNAQVELELRQSKQLIENATQQDVYAVGYPMGGVNSRVEQLAADNGYLLGIGSAPDRTFERSQFLRLPSLVITANDTVEDVLADVVLE